MEVFGHQIREDVIRFARLAYEVGLVPNTQGNVSVRDPESNLILITPHDLPYGAMSEEDLVVVDLQGKKVSGPRDSSFETPVHCTVYRERPDLHALVHTEPVYVNCLGALGIPIEPVVVSLLVNLGGTVPVMPYMPSGSREFGHAMVEVMGNVNGVIWANHGLMTVGNTVEQAFRRSVVVEHAAQVLHAALLHGRPNILDTSHLPGATA